jgi:hypothetical protein
MMIERLMSLTTRQQRRGRVFLVPALSFYQANLCARNWRWTVRSRSIIAAVLVVRDAVRRRCLRGTLASEMLIRDMAGLPEHTYQDDIAMIDAGDEAHAG